MGKNKDKKKKEKIRYVDDGRTIADMSALSGKRPEKGEKGAQRPISQRSTLKEQFETYIGAVKMMFLPMLATLGLLAVAFIVLYIILSFL